MNFRNLAKKYNILQDLLIIIFLSFLWVSSLLWKPGPMGESDDYMLQTISLQYRGDLEVRESDLEKAKVDFPEFADYLDENYHNVGMSSFVDNEGGKLPWYFGTYSACCIPVKIILKVLGLPQIYTFTITNILIYTVALLLVAWHLKLDNMNKFLLLISLMINPVVFYMVWQSAEVTIFSFVVMTLVFWNNKEYKLAALANSIAGTLNSTIMILGIVLICDYLFELCKGQIKDKNILIILKNNAVKIISFGCCFIPCLVPFVYYKINYGVWNLQLDYGFASADNYIGRIKSYLFDLNYGLLPYFTLMLPLFFVLAIIGLINKKYKILLNMVAFIGVISVFSIMKHINCGMSGIARYNVWVAPIMNFAILTNYQNIINRKIGIFLSNLTICISIICTSIIINVYGFTFAKNTSDVRLTPVAKYVLERYPYLYNPLPSTFITRVTHQQGGYEYNEPVFFQNDEGYITKILLDKDTASQIKSCVIGNDESMAYLENKLVCENCEGLHYININYKKYPLVLDPNYVLNNNKHIKNGKIDLSSLKTNGYQSETKIILQNGQIQYGPYISLQKGKYIISIHGDNLNKINYWVSAESGKIHINIVELYRDQNTIQYKFELVRNYDNVEFGTRNDHEEEVYIDSISIDVTQN